jgi:nucleotide-binding universal stress UspA family protein
MVPNQPRSRVRLKKVLYLTDFSEPSEAALPFAISVARKRGAHLHALHVLLPCLSISTTRESAAIAIAHEEERAQADLERLDSQLAGVPHDTRIERALGVWEAVEPAIENLPADLVVLGTHGPREALAWFRCRADFPALDRSRAHDWPEGPPGNAQRGGVSPGDLRNGLHALVLRGRSLCGLACRGNPRATDPSSRHQGAFAGQKRDAAGAIGGRGDSQTLRNRPGIYGLRECSRRSRGIW